MVVWVVDPSYNFISGRLNFRGSSMEVMDPKKGVSEIVPTQIFLTVSLTPSRLERISYLNSCISLRIVEANCCARLVGEIC